MPPNAIRSALRWLLLAVVGLAVPGAAAQVFTTTPGYSNNVKPGNATSSASATLASGSNYATNARPAEAGSARFKLDSWTVGMPFSSAPPDFAFGDVITPPPLVDVTKTPTVATANGAFYMTSRRQLIAAQAGTCQVTWPLTDGTTKTLTYNIGAVPVIPTSRLFWTDNYIPGGVNTNTAGVPDNSQYAVSLNNLYAKVHYNSVVPDFDTTDSQDNSAGRAARSANAVGNLGLSAVWIDSNSLIRARNQSGYLIVEYFDTPTFDNSAGYEVVYVGPARVYSSSVFLGDRLLPSEGATVAAGLQAATSKASGYVVQWTAAGSDFSNYIFATAVNSDDSLPNGDPSKTQLLWQRTGNLGVVWPYEAHWYAITWPGDQSANQFVFDPTNPAGSPTAAIPTNYTASIVWSEKSGSVLTSDSAAATISAVGEGRALIQYQNGKDVWFIPVRAVARTNGAYVANQEVFWPVGLPLQPVANMPRLQFDGVGNYLSFPTSLAPGLTTELWIKPNATTNFQTLAAFQDYPQQASVQAALLLADAQLRLSVYTGGTVTNDVLIADPGFESAVADSAHYATSIPGWSFSGGGVAVNANGVGPFVDNGHSQNGGNVAALQNGSGISQTITGLVPGETYTLTFNYNARGGNTPHLRVQADSATLFDNSFTNVGGTTAYYVASVNFTSANPSFVLSFTEYNTNSTDNTALVDGVRIYRTGSSVQLTSTNSVPAGVWTHVAFTKATNGALQLFINGVPDVTGTAGTFNALPPNNSSYAEAAIGEGFPVIGAVTTATSLFAGEIKEVRIWGTQIDPTTLAHNISAQLTGGEANLTHLITPSWQESGTPFQGTGGASFLVLDKVTGEDVSAYGTPNTTGQLPFALTQRLGFNGANNWAEVPYTWNRSDAISIEFWYFSGSVNGSQTLLAATATGVTNVQVGLAGSQFYFKVGTNTAFANILAIPNTSYHVAVSSTNGTAIFYINGVSQNSQPLPGTGSAPIASKLVLAASTTLQGSCLEQVFSGQTLSSIESSSFDFTTPTVSRLLPSWEAPVGQGNNYAQRIQALFTPVITGDYVFYTSSDDASDLFLSTDNSAVHKRLIAQETSWSSVDNWTNSEASKRSVPIHLLAGSSYYIEQYHAQGGGGDNASITFSIKSAGDPDPANGTPSRLTGSLISVPGNSGSVEISDFRIYATSHNPSQITSDLNSAADLTDSTLVRLYTFDHVSPANVSGESVLQLPDQARGYYATYHGAASLGSTLSYVAPPEVSGGVVRSGTAYHPGIYAGEGRIIPVNDVSTNSLIEVWWSESFTAPFLAQPLNIPSTVTRYRLMDPLAPPVLVVAGQNYSGYPVPSTWTQPSIYYQNDPTAVGYNPNEEHALLCGSAVYAMRWDLNQPNTSSGYVLLQYKDQERGSLSYLQPIQVVPTNATYPSFDSQLLVGQLLQAPVPLIYLPTTVRSGPIPGADPLHRLYQDRQYFWWARSASSGTPDSVPSRWWYPLQPGFYWPSTLGNLAAGAPVPFGNTSNGLAINYTIQWPTVVPTLALGQTLSDAMPSANGNGDLPAVTGQKSVEILFDEANYASKSSAVIVDPSSTSSAQLANLNGINTATDVQLGKTYFTLLPPHMRDRVTWDPIAQLLTLSGGVVRPVTGFPYVLPAWLGQAGNTNTDLYALSSLSTAPAWQNAVNVLRRGANVIPNAETPFDSIVLTPSGFAGGHVTLGVNTRTNQNNTGDPVILYPIFVDTTVLYTGTVLVLYSDNKFDQYTTLKHSGDFGGDPTQYQFDWRYSPPNNGQVPTDPNTNLSSWISYTPVTQGLNRIIFGGPGLLTLKDEYFSVRWRCTAAGAPNTNWSSWTSPALVQSWLTRALDGINPFDQRVSSLANNQLDLTTSILAQAGKRFVGAVPLNMDNADSFGLIETYETLLQQARNLSIDAGYSDNDVNASLLDSASKLNELYMDLGDEALSDAKDPTIAWGSQDLNEEFFGSRASSLFAFQGIVPTLLEEELALLRGLDDTTSTPVTTYPVYNRLYWNFTKGINSGEPAYALNYGIPSVVSNSNGSITEADAAKLYPQGHGDAYGHYLTALYQYYRLLNNTNFTWYPRADVQTIGGVNVTFDYVDERKMAASAYQLGLTAVEIIDRTFRRDYKLDSSQRTPLYVDSNSVRAWSATEWCERSSQGLLYNWILLNSLLQGATPYDTPQTITRATVPEVAQIAGLVNTIQDKQDDIDRGDSPMGVAANVVPFDLDPTLVDAGQGHFDQVYSRAVAAMQAAYTVLQRASVAGANLRRQDVSLDAFRYQIAQRETEFNQQLVDLYGSPYPDDIGATGTFSSGYNGPDLYHYNYIDKDIFNPSDAGAVTNVSFYAQYSITGDNLDTLTAVGTNVSYSINSDGIPVMPASWNGQRAIYGKIQGALGDYIRAWISLRGAIALQDNHKQQLQARLQRLQDHNSYSTYYGNIGDNLAQQQTVVNLVQQGLDATLATLDTADAEIQSAYEASKDPLPASFIAGLADGGDLSFPARIGLAITKLIGEESIGAAKDAANFASYAAGKVSAQYDSQIAANNDALAGAEDQSQTVMETTMLLSNVNADRDSVYGAAVALRQAWQTYISLVAKGNQTQTDLLAFREANAARIQEARYADVIFRTFKNEDLEEYLNAFQQASRYVFAAARVYDYETGLLDPTVVSGQTGDFMGDTMKATQLGDMVDGQPVPGSSNAGALASILAQMHANWGVLKGRFGINNPTHETHKISLRQELFRIGHSTDPIVEANNVSAWQNKLYTYRVADIRQVPEFKNYCQLYSPMGTNEPALVITFSTEVNAGKNVFGLPLTGGDTVFDSAHFTTKIRGAALSFVGYNQNAGATLTKSPRAYLVPAGIDRQRTPLSGGVTVRDWRVVDQVWPIPYPSAAGNVNLPLQSIGTDNVHTIRRFPPMRAYDDGDLTTAGSVTYDSRLIARSVWNTEWVLIIPGSTLSSSASSALDNLIEGITDINLLLDTYSYSGN